MIESFCMTGVWGVWVQVGVGRVYECCICQGEGIGRSKAGGLEDSRFVLFAVLKNKLMPETLEARIPVDSGFYPCKGEMLAMIV